MDRLKTLSTFLAGVIVGGGAVYLSPAQPSGVDPAIPPMGTGSPEFLPPPTADGLPGQAPPPGTAPQLMPGSPPLGTPPPGMEPPAGPPPSTSGAATGASAPAPGTAGGAPPSETPAAPLDRPAQSGSRLETHLRAAPEAWTGVLTRARAGSPAGRALAPEVEAHQKAIPAVKEHMPPLQDMAAYLAGSKVLLDKLASAGVDVAELSAEVAVLLRPPRGDVPGGEIGGRRPRAPQRAPEAAPSGR